MTARFHVSEFGDAELGERLAQHFAGRFRHASGLGWLEYDGKRWGPVEDKVPYESAREWVKQSMRAALRTADTTEDTAKLAKAWVGVAHTRGRIVSLVATASGIPGITAAADDFDKHAHLLNCDNGVVDLRDGKLYPHDPALLLTHITPTAYRPDAGHVDWQKALGAVRSDAVSWLQVRLGQAIVGSPPPDDVLLLLHGGGENGKSTLINALEAAVGDGYHTVVSDNALMPAGNGHTTDIMPLRGARLAILEETPERGRLDPARLKKLVGTAKITARLIRQDPVTWRASHSLVVTSNHRPEVTETDHGTWRRLALLSFPHRYVKPGQPVGPGDVAGDPTLRDRVERDPAVAEAVLAWLVAGAIAFYTAGEVMPPMPASVEADTLEWRKSSDAVLRFWSEELTAHPAAHVDGAELFARFQAWLFASGQQNWSRKTFEARFGDHSETRAHGLAKRRLRRGASENGHRSTIAAGLLPTDGNQAAQYTAWCGVGFAEDPALIAAAEAARRDADTP